MLRILCIIYFSLAIIVPVIGYSATNIITPPVYVPYNSLGEQNNPVANTNMPSDAVIPATKSSNGVVEPAVVSNTKTNNRPIKMKSSIPAINSNKKPAILKDIYMDGFGILGIKDEVYLVKPSTTNNMRTDEDADPISPNSAPFSLLNIILGMNNQMKERLTTFFVNFELRNGAWDFKRASFSSENAKSKIVIGDFKSYMDPLSAKQDQRRDKFNADIFDLDGGYTANYFNRTNMSDKGHLTGTLSELPLMGMQVYYKVAELGVSKMAKNRYFVSGRIGLFGKEKSTEFLQPGKPRIYVSTVKVLDNESLVAVPVDNQLIGGLLKINLMKNYNLKVNYYSSSVKNYSTNALGKSLTGSAYDVGIDYQKEQINLGVGYYSTGRDYIALAAQAPYSETSFNANIQVMNYEYLNADLKTTGDIAFPQKEATPNRAGLRAGLKYEKNGLSASAHYRSGANVGSVQYWTNAGTNFRTTTESLKAQSYEFGVEKKLGRLLKLQAGYHASSLKAGTNINNSMTRIDAGVSLFLGSSVSILYGYKQFHSEIKYQAVGWTRGYNADTHSVGLLYTFLPNATALFQWKLIDQDYTVNSVSIKSKESLFGLTMRYQF